MFRFKIIILLFVFICLFFEDCFSNDPFLIIHIFRIPFYFLYLASHQYFLLLLSGCSSANNMPL